MTATAKKTEVPMMVGTSGYKDYMAFAKNGAFALGIKPTAAVDGKRLGVPGSTWFAARLRSASSKELFEAPESNLVTFKKLPESHNEAWPSITWEKNSSERASTTISILVPGSANDKAGMEQLIASIGNGQLATKMVDYLEQIAGKENFALSREDAIAWFSEQYDGYAKKLIAILEAQENMTKELEASKGTFGMHAELLKKVYKASHGEDAPEEKIVQSDEDADNADGPDFTDDQDNDSY